MKQIYDLSQMGLSDAIELSGNLTIVRDMGIAPIVFLFDEHHGNLNNCIDKNIQNAEILITNANIALVGVESLAGGKEWDEETEDYVVDDSNERYYKEYILKDWKSNCTKFSDEVIKISHEIVLGVESVGMMNKVEVDIIDSNPIDQSAAIRSHPLTRLRSKHFISTIGEKYKRDNLNGNIILNCGSEHNDHIIEWVNSGEIDTIIGMHANYVRLNTFR